MNLDPNGLIFSTVTKFVQQPERTKRRTKRDDLDTLTEVWVGPSGGEDSFVPAVGAVHPSFTLMTVIDTSIKRLPASVSEVTINYQGKLDSSGTSIYTSVPTISQSWMEGEVSYQTVYTQDVRVPTGQGGYYTYPDFGLNTFSRRYTGRAAQLAYITTVRPTGNPTQLGLATEFLGFTNVWETLTAQQPGASFVLQGEPIEQMTCTDVKIEDRADGWYRVTETYQSKQFPGPAIRGPTFGAIGVATKVVGGTETQPAPVTARNTLSGWTTSGAQGAANDAGQSLPSADPGSVQADTAQQTGLDPTWASTTDATTAATAMANSYQTNPTELATPSALLDY